MDAIEELLGRFVEARAIPGAVAVVGHGDDVEITVVGRQGIDGTPMQEDSLFRVASAAKPITAVAALVLVADGVLHLDDPIASVVPELAGPRVLRTPTSRLDDTVPCTGPITVRDLLRSTNGLGQTAEFGSPISQALFEQLHQGPPRPAEMPGPDAWMARVAELPLVHQPGAGFTYNTAYDILGVLVSRVTGRSFSEHVADRVLRPLGMVDSGFSYASEVSDRATSLYQEGEGGLHLVDGPGGQWSAEPEFASGAGGMVSTVGDLLRFGRMLLDGGGAVLAPDLVEAMTTDQLSAEIRATDSMFLDGQTWGYGGGVDIERRDPWNVPGRYGWVGGTGTSLHIVADDGSIAILLTQVELGGPSSAEVLEAFWTAAADRLGHSA